jgi:hypothetical protein
MQAIAITKQWPPIFWTEIIVAIKKKIASDRKEDDGTSVVSIK